MKGLKALIIKANGENVDIDIEGVPGLDFLQLKVGGYIEVVPFFDRIVIDEVEYPAVAFCDEEGKMKGKPVNTGATELWRAIIPVNDVLNGDVIIVYGNQKLLDRI